MNTPYVKQYNELGEVTNPIIDKYESRTIVPIRQEDGSVKYVPLKNRAERRAKTKGHNCRRKGLNKRGVTSR